MKDRIRIIRNNAGLTLKQFADRIGSTNASISRYESGERIPSNAVIVSICREFHVSYLWLTTGEGPMNDIDPADDTPARLAQAYSDLPQRFQDAVQVLMGMTPEWWKVLDQAFAAWEEEKKNAGE